MGAEFHQDNTERRIWRELQTTTWVHLVWFFFGGGHKTITKVDCLIPILPKKNTIKKKVKVKKKENIQTKRLLCLLMGGTNCQRSTLGLDVSRRCDACQLAIHVISCEHEGENSG